MVVDLLRDAASETQQRPNEIMIWAVSPVTLQLLQGDSTFLSTWNGAFCANKHTYELLVSLDRISGSKHHSSLTGEAMSGTRSRGWSSNLVIQ